MTGRLTSESAPARNEHGVPYVHLLQMERKIHSLLIEQYRAALEAWLAVDKAYPNSSKRRVLRERARALTESVLS